MAKKTIEKIGQVAADVGMGVFIGIPVLTGLLAVDLGKKIVCKFKELLKWLKKSFAKLKKKFKENLKNIRVFLKDLKKEVNTKLKDLLEKQNEIAYNNGLKTKTVTEIGPLSGKEKIEAGVETLTSEDGTVWEKRTEYKWIPLSELPETIIRNILKGKRNINITEHVNKEILGLEVC